MSEYTPTTDDVRRSFVYAESSDFVATVPGTGEDSWARVPAQGDIKVTRVRDGELHKAATAAFDRWLAEVRRQAAEEALRDGIGGDFFRELLFEAREEAWDEGYSAGEEGAGIGIASLITGLQAPMEPQNPYRQERKEQ